MQAYLYWVKSTEPEDWFIVAPNKFIAAECHECGEGLNEGDAKAELICEIPYKLELKHKRSEMDILHDGYWPSLDLLSALDFQFIEKDPPYILKLNGRVFYQGGATYDLLLPELNDFGVYIINMRGTNKYKIGYTKNIERRLKQFATGNPHAIDLHFFLFTKEARQIERRLHSILSARSTVREWFEINIYEEIISAIKILSSEYKITVFDSKRYIGR